MILQKSYRAFTFVECLVVILITILLASIVLPGIFKEKKEPEKIEFTIPGEKSDSQ